MYRRPLWNTRLSCSVKSESPESRASRHSTSFLTVFLKRSRSSELSRARVVVDETTTGLVGELWVGTFSGQRRSVWVGVSSVLRC